MQTFLPVANFEQTAKMLDYKRLGKQRVEAKQILMALYRLKHGILRNPKTGRKYGWLSHPAVLMWQGYEDALVVYYNTMIDEWVARGYNNTMLRGVVSNPQMPVWLGDERLHRTHRGRLLAKDETHYSQFGWSDQPIPDSSGYWWPV